MMPFDAGNVRCFSIERCAIEIHASSWNISEFICFWAVEAFRIKSNMKFETNTTLGSCGPHHATRMMLPSRFACNRFIWIWTVNWKWSATPRCECDQAQSNPTYNISHLHSKHTHTHAGDAHSHSVTNRVGKNHIHEMWNSKTFKWILIATCVMCIVFWAHKQHASWITRLCSAVNNERSLRSRTSSHFDRIIMRSMDFRKQQNKAMLPYPSQSHYRKFNWSIFTRRK